MDKPLVSIIIVNWNGIKYLSRCLNSVSLQTYKKTEIIVVDNNSTDGSIDFISKESPHIKLIKNKKNYGFARGNNIGIRAAKGEYIVTMNNDTELEPECVDEMVNAVKGDASVGMCASKILLFNNRNLIDSAGMLMYPDGLAICRGHLAEDAHNFNIIEEVFLPTACVALYKKDAIVRAGFFDDDYFAYCEDTDLGLRIRMLGYRCVYVPTARAYHHYSGTIGKGLALKVHLSERNRLFTIVKCHSIPTLAASLYYTAIRYILYAYASFRNLGQIKDFTRTEKRLKIFYILFKAYSCFILNTIKLVKKRLKIASNRDMKYESIYRLSGKFKIKARDLVFKRKIYID